MPDIDNNNEWAEENDIPNPDGPRADLPMIILPYGEQSITEAAEQLFRLMANSMRYFTRGGKVMKLKSRDGSTVLHVLDAEEARSDFEKFGRLVVRRAGANGERVFKPTVCPSETAKALLASQEAHDLLPEIKSLINCPIIHEKGEAIAVSGPGYDAITKVLVTGGEIPPEVDLDTARTTLLEPLDEFDLQSESDKSRAAASFITPGLKLAGFIKGRVPADVAEADQSQSGKTYRQKLVAAIYNERVSLVTNRQGGVGSVDESFGQQLVAGKPFIQFDNFRGRLDSQYLEAFFTADGSFPCRIPHKGEIQIQPENFFISLTSNGVATTRDFANRSSIIRIRKKPPGFVFRRYQEGDLLAHIRAKQAFYLGCVFAIIREWHRKGKQRTEETRHDFREWAQILDWIVQNIFKLAPLLDGHQEAQQRVSRPEFVFVREFALSLERTDGFGQQKTALDIFLTCEANGISVPGLRDASVSNQRGAQVVGMCMSRLFKDTETVEIDGYRVERQIDKTPIEVNGSGNGSFNTKHYVFSRVSKQGAQKEAEEPIKKGPELGCDAPPGPNPFEKTCIPV